MSADDHLRPMSDPRPDWHDYAVCIGQTATFYPPTPKGRPREQHNAKVAAEAKAIAICQQCPVIDHCRREAVETGEIHGIHGGLTEDQLRDRRRATGSAVCPPAVCAVCGVIFAPRRPGGCYCSQNCARLARNEQQAGYAKRDADRRRTA